MSTFRVYDSHGELAVSSTSGRILDYIDFGGGEYANVTFFNLDEWHRAFAGQKLEHIDILAIGYWTDAGDYEPPALDYRQLMISEGG